MDETKADLEADFAELGALVGEGFSRLSAHQARLLKGQAHYQPKTFAMLCASANDIAAEFQKLLAEIQANVVATKSAGSAHDLTEIITNKKALYDMARTLQSTLASVLCAGEWQSPSFEHTIFPEAGSKTGTVRVGTSDYKRDIYPDEQAYAQAFVGAYVDQGMRLAPVAFPTSSCMAAITTVLGHLRSGVKDSDRILVGKSTYFQTRWIVEHLFPGQVAYIDESDTGAIVAFARTPLTLVKSLALASIHPLMLNEATEAAVPKSTK